MSVETNEIELAAVFPWIYGVRWGAEDASRIPDKLDLAKIESRSLDAIIGDLATVAMEQLGDSALVHLVSHAGDGDVEALELSPRAMNRLRYHGVKELESIWKMSISDLGAMRNAGKVVVRDIVEALFRRAVREGCREPVTLPRGQESEQRMGEHPRERSAHTDASLEISDALRAYVDDLRLVSRVLAALGRSDVPLIEGFLEGEQPRAIAEAMERIESWTAAELFPVDASGGLLAAAVEEALAKLDGRQVDILRRRFFADEPETLQALGEDLGITRERVRQLENMAVGDLRGSLASDIAVETAQEAVFAKVSHVQPVEALLWEFPSLCHLIPSLGVAVWRVLDRLDDRYEIADGWAAVPSVARVVDSFRETLEPLAGSYNLVPVADLRLKYAEEWITRSRSNLRRWLDYCGLDTLEGFILTGRGAMLDRALAVLAAKAEPMTAEDIHDRLGIDRSLRSLKNQMGEDPRFERVGRNSWALVDWGMQSYTSIRDAIGTALSDAGGSVSLSDLVELVSRTAGVSPRSVVAYSMAYPFETVAGQVRFASSPRKATAQPERCRNMYRRHDGWLLRVVLTHDHVRGSGSQMPMGLASLLGMEEGETAFRPTICGEQSFYWTGMQPAIGSVRALVEYRGLEEGDAVFLVLRDAGTFDIEKVREAEPQSTDALLASMGRTLPPSAEDADVLAEIVEALLLPPGSGLDEVRQALLSRDETDTALSIASVEG